VAIVASAHSARVRRCSRAQAKTHAGTPTRAYITQGWLSCSQVCANEWMPSWDRVASVAAVLTSWSRPMSGPNCVRTK